MIWLADDDQPPACRAAEPRPGGNGTQRPKAPGDRYRTAQEGMHYLLGCLITSCVAALISVATLAVILRLVRWAFGW